MGARTKLDGQSVRYLLAKLREHLSSVDREGLEKLTSSLDESSRQILVSKAQRLLYPKAEPENAGAYLRQLRGRLNQAAEQAQVPLALCASPGKRGGADRRWLWFEGIDPVADRAQAFSDAETGELDKLPAIAAQRALPIDGALEDDRPIVRWFLCWAHKDKKFKERLFENLNVRLRNSRRFRFEVWHDGMILLGADWKAAIESALAAVDFGLLLLSDHFLQSEFIQNVELPPLVKKHAVPVCLRKLNFDRVDLHQLRPKQIFRDGDEKAFSERVGEKAKDWTDELAARIEDMLEKQPPRPGPGGPRPTPEQPRPSPAGRGHPARADKWCSQALLDLDRAGDALVEALALQTSLEKDRPEEFQVEGAGGASRAVDVLEHLMQWVSDPEAPPLMALLGEYGMGKTITCQRLVRELEERRKQVDALPPPLYLDLRNLAGLGEGVPVLRDVVSECLRRGQSSALSGDPLDFKRFEELVRQGALVIFDGLDEALVHLKESDGQIFTRELLKLLPDRPGKPTRSQSAAPRAVKLLISCRTNYFRTLRDQQNHFTGQERGPVSARDYRALLLLPFTEEQVGTYLAKALPKADVAQLQETIRSVHNLTELTQRPYTLKLVSSFIPDIERWRAEGRRVNGVTLYRRLVQSWLERDAGKHQLKPDHKLRFMAFLAAAMWRAGTRVMESKKLDDWLHQWLQQDPALERRYRNLHPEKLEEDLRTATFLVRQDARQDGKGKAGAGFRFAHSSLLEFFLAEHLRLALVEGRRSDWALPLPSRETLDFLGQMLEAGAGEGGTDGDVAASLRRLEAWRQPYLAQASDLLLAYTLCASERGWPAPDLTGIDLRGANLSRRRFTGREDTPLVLTGADLRGATLRRAEFRHVRLDGADFGSAHLDGAAFLDCTASDARFAGSVLAGTIFRNTRLTGATWPSGSGSSGHGRSQFIACKDAPAPAELPQALFAPRPVDAMRDSSARGALRLFAGQTDSVTSCAFSPDGRTVLSGSDDNTLQLWDAATGQLLRRLEGHAERVRSCAFSPDGRTVLSASDDKTLRLWDAASGELLRRFEGNTVAVRTCAFALSSRDCQTVLSGSDDGMLKLWDAASGELLRRFEGHTGAVTSCALSHSSWDCQAVLSGSADKTLRLWDAASGRQLRCFEGHTDAVTSCAFAFGSRDYQTVLSGSDDGTLRLWEAASGVLLRTFEGHGGGVMSCACSPCGRTVLSGEDKTLRLWDATSGDQLRTFGGQLGAVTSCAFSPSSLSDGQMVLSGSDDGILRLWHAASGQLLRRFEKHGSRVMSCAFSPDGQTVLSGSGDRLRLWDAASGQLLRCFDGPGGWVRSCAYSPDGQTVLSCRSDGLRLSDAVSGKLLCRIGGDAGLLRSCAFSPDGGLVLSGSAGTLRLWNVATGKMLRSFDTEGDLVMSCAFSPDGRTVLSGSIDKTLRLWEAATGKLLRCFERHEGVVRSCAFSHDGRTVLSGGRDRALRLWDTATGNLIRRFDGHASSVNSCAFAPDGQTVLSGSGDGTLCLWDANSGQLLLRFDGHASWVMSCAFSPDGRTVLSGGDDNTLRLWDVASGRCLRIHAIVEGGHAVWEPETNRIIEASGDAWRWLGWQVPDGQGGLTRIPAESYGPLPAPRRLAESAH